MSSLQLRHPEKDFDLGVFLPVAGNPFVVAIQSSCNDVSQYSIYHFRSICSSIKLLFNELEELNPELLTEIQCGVTTFGKKSSWMKFVALVYWRLQGHNLSSSGKNKYISGLNYIFFRLQNDGFIPRFNALSTFKIEKKVSKSLLDFCFDEYEVFGGEPEGEDINEIGKIVESLQTELGDVSSENIADLCACLLKNRLTVIRSEAEKQFIRCGNLRLSGLLAIRKYRYLLPVVDQWFAWRKSRDAGATNPYKDNINQLSDEQWWGVYLAWCWYRNGGVEPKSGVLASREYNMIRKQFWSRKDRRADLATAEAIGCSMEFIASASILLIHDLVANVDSIRNIAVNADSVTDYGAVDIEWVKPRAKGLLTAIDCRERKCSPAKVIRIIRRATTRYRKIAADHFRNQLFLHHHSAKGSSKKNYNQKHVTPMVPSSFTLLNYIKNIIHAASGGLWGGTARSIRVSLLLYKGLTGGLIAVQQAAQHNSIRTSMLYSNSIPMRLAFDQKMREFREWLQVLVTVDLEDVPIKLGLDQDQYECNKNKILASQFGGVYCRDPRAGIQPGTQKGENCGAISKCMTCGNKKNLFVVTENNIVQLLQWNEALKKADEVGEIDVVEETDWAFWCVFIEVVLERLYQGGERYRSLLHSAKVKLDFMENPYLRIDFGGL
ncbi:hypothetical protein [Aurantivibrio plasticivorans]